MAGQCIYVRLRYSRRTFRVDYRWDLILEYALGAVTGLDRLVGLPLSPFCGNLALKHPARTYRRRRYAHYSGGWKAVTAIFICQPSSSLPSSRCSGDRHRESATVTSNRVCESGGRLLFIFGRFTQSIPPTGIRSSAEPGVADISAGAASRKALDRFFRLHRFDAVSTPRKKQRIRSATCPSASSLTVICTVLYIAVSAVATASFLTATGCTIPCCGGLTTRDSVGCPPRLSWAQSRPQLRNSRDAPWPVADFLGRCRRWFASRICKRVHPNPHSLAITILTGIVVAFLCGAVTVREAWQPRFHWQVASVRDRLNWRAVLRIREPHLPRTFRTRRCGRGPTGGMSALYLMIALPWRTWERLSSGSSSDVIYFFYGVRRSNCSGQDSGDT